MNEDDEIWLDDFAPRHSIVVFEEGDPSEPKDTGLLAPDGSRIMYQPRRIKMGFAITKEHSEVEEDSDYYYPEVDHVRRPA